MVVLARAAERALTFLRLHDRGEGEDAGGQDAEVLRLICIVFKFVRLL